MKRDTLNPRYAHILETCTPYLITYTANLSVLDRAPFGVPIDEAHTFTATSLRSRDVVNGLHHLDSFSFGPQEMLMPRWVLFDCGEFPGIVFGFGRRAATLAAGVRRHYHVEAPEKDDVFVPLSMWVAIRNAEEGAWFGHNLSSANLVLGDERLPGLGTLTKLFGVRVAKARRQYGATQWTSSSLGIHMTMGDLELLSAYTPAHTHEETFSYRIEVDDARLESALEAGWKRPTKAADATFGADDPEAIRALHDEIEGGARFALANVERGAVNRLHIVRL